MRKIGIIGAMAVEVEAILRTMDVAGETDKAEMRFIHGTLEGARIIVARCGAGKVNAALCTQLMIDLFQPDAILNIGVAGGIAEEVQIGDVVIATNCIQSDFDTRPLGDPLGAVSTPGGTVVRAVPCDTQLSADLEREARHICRRVHRGVIVSGDTFIASQDQKSTLLREFSAIACEMEGAAVAYACSLNQVPCAVLRSISDSANETADVNFAEFAKQAAEQSQKILRAFCAKKQEDETGRE